MNKFFLMPEKTILITVLLISITGLVANISQARQFRLLTPIASPEQPLANVPAGAVAVEAVTPLSRQVVEPMVRKVIEQWNTPGMISTLSDQFYDKSRLLDVMDTGVPRDAKLRVQSIQGIQTLQQYINPGAGTERGEMVSIVSATVQTQLEFNSSNGFTRLPGTNEFILQITQTAPP